MTKIRRIDLSQTTTEELVKIINEKKDEIMRQRKIEEVLFEKRKELDSNHLLSMEEKQEEIRKVTFQQLSKENLLEIYYDFLYDQADRNLVKGHKEGFKVGAVMGIILTSIAVILTMIIN
jgi:hypothetical protein